LKLPFPTPTCKIIEAHLKEETTIFSDFMVIVIDQRLNGDGTATPIILTIANRIRTLIRCGY